MNIAVPGKIVLKSSTSKSLSERFGEIAKKSQVENVRNKQRTEAVASVKNRRLAAQMAKRVGIEETPAKATVKSRLSVPVANRLGTKTRGQMRGREVGVRTRRGGGGQQGNVTTRFQRGGGQNRGQGGATTRGRGSFRGGRTTRGGRGAMRGGRGAMRGVRGGGRIPKGRGRQANQPGQVAARGGRGRGRGGNKKPPTKEQLDTELDTYMSKTKSVLNSQLDDYMKGSD